MVSLSFNQEPRQPRQILRNSVTHSHVHTSSLWALTTPQKEKKREQTKGKKKTKEFELTDTQIKYIRRLKEHNYICSFYDCYKSIFYTDLWGIAFQPLLWVYVLFFILLLLFFL